MRSRAVSSQISMAAEHYAAVARRLELESSTYLRRDIGHSGLAPPQHPSSSRTATSSTVTIDPPESKNACTGDMWVALGAIFRDLGYSGARAVVLTGADGEFCTGADLERQRRERRRAPSAGPPEHDARRDAGARRRGARHPRLPGPGDRQGRRAVRRRRPRAGPRRRPDLVLGPGPLLGDLRQAGPQPRLRHVVAAAPAHRRRTRPRSWPSPARMVSGPEAFDDRAWSTRWCRPTSSTTRVAEVVATDRRRSADRAVDDQARARQRVGARRSPRRSRSRRSPRASTCRPTTCARR